MRSAPTAHVHALATGYWLEPAPLEIHSRDEYASADLYEGRHLDGSRPVWASEIRVPSVGTTPPQKNCN